MFKWLLFSALLSVFIFSSKLFISYIIILTILYSDVCKADDDTETLSSTLPPKVDDHIGKHSDASKTDDETVQK